MSLNLHSVLRCEIFFMVTSNKFTSHVFFVNEKQLITRRAVSGVLETGRAAVCGRVSSLRNPEASVIEGLDVIVRKVDGLQRVVTGIEIVERVPVHDEGRVEIIQV